MFRHLRFHVLSSKFSFFTIFSPPIFSTDSMNKTKSVIASIMLKPNAIQAQNEGKIPRPTSNIKILRNPFYLAKVRSSIEFI
jgi:hypothetical protein